MHVYILEKHSQGFSTPEAVAEALKEAFFEPGCLQAIIKKEEANSFEDFERIITEYNLVRGIQFNDFVIYKNVTRIKSNH